MKKNSIDTGKVKQRRKHVSYERTSQAELVRKVKEAHDRIVGKVRFGDERKR